MKLRKQIKLLVTVSLTGIIQINMNRPEAKNALGKDFLKGLQNSFEAVSVDSSAKVLMICSSVSKVFCAGADLKVAFKTCNSLKLQFQLLDHKYFRFSLRKEEPWIYPKFELLSTH